MPLPQAVKEVVETKLSQFCETRIPAHAKDQVRLGYKIRGNFVTLFEERPIFRQIDTWAAINIAQFRFDPQAQTWRLFWADRNSRWHEYYDIDAARNIDQLLEEVDADPTGIFWG